MGSVSLFMMTWTDRMDEFINGLQGENIIGARSIEEFVRSLEHRAGL